MFFFCFCRRCLVPLRLTEGTQPPPRPKQMGYQMRKLKDSSKPLVWTSANAPIHTNTWLLPGKCRQPQYLNSQTHYNLSILNTNGKTYIYIDTDRCRKMESPIAYIHGHGPAFSGKKCHRWQMQFLFFIYLWQWGMTIIVDYDSFIRATVSSGLRGVILERKKDS